MHSYITSYDHLFSVFCHVNQVAFPDELKTKKTRVNTYSLDAHGVTNVCVFAAFTTEYCKPVTLVSYVRKFHVEKRTVLLSFSNVNKGRQNRKKHMQSLKNK
jgi:hypothetical protein